MKLRSASEAVYARGEAKVSESPRRCDRGFDQGAVALGPVGILLRRTWGGLLPFVVRCQELERLPKDLDPVHLVYALVGAIGVIFHQAEECKRVTGIDPFDEAAIEAHTRVVEHLFLDPEDC